MHLWLPEKGGPIRPILVSSKVTRVVFNSKSNEQPNTTSSIIDAIFSSPQLSLKHLAFDAAVNLTSMAPVMSSYGGLKTLKLAVSKHVWPILPIVASQKELESLYLTAEKTPMSAYHASRFKHSYRYIALDDKSLFSTLSALFQRHNFYSLTIKGFHLPEGGVKMLIAAFLMSTPSTEKCSLNLKHSELLPEETQTFTYDQPVSISQEHAEKFGSRKHLHLLPMKQPFYDWFAAIPHIRLATLSGRCDCHILVYHDIQPHFKGHPNFKVDRISDGYD